MFVKDVKYYQTALTNRSYVRSEYNLIDPDVLKNSRTNNTLELFDESNERLEFLGDTIIKCVVSEYLFRRFYEEDEGFLTRIKTKIEDKDSLARYAKRLGLDHYYS